MIKWESKYKDLINCYSPFSKYRFEDQRRQSAGNGEKTFKDMYLKHSNSYIKSFLDDYLSNCLSNELTIKAYLPFVGLD